MDLFCRDTNSFKNTNFVEDMNEFPSNFTSGDFNEVVFSPTMIAKHKASFDEIASSLNNSLCSFELAKEEVSVT
jgi:hypothetical protein